MESGVSWPEAWCNTVPGVKPVVRIFKQSIFRQGGYLEREQKSGVSRPEALCNTVGPFVGVVEERYLCQNKCGLVLSSVQCPVSVDLQASGILSLDKSWKSRG